MKRGRLRRNGVKSAPASSSIIDLLLGSPLQPQHYKQQVNNAVSRPRPRRGRMGEESNENRFLATKLPDYDGAYAASSPQNNLGSLSIGQADTEMQECEQVKEEDIVVKLLRMIMVREDYLEHLRLANHVFKGNEKVWRELLDLLLFLRKVSLHIVSLLDYWKEHLVRPYNSNQPPPSFILIRICMFNAHANVLYHSFIILVASCRNANLVHLYGIIRQII